MELDLGAGPSSRNFDAIGAEVKSRSIGVKAGSWSLTYSRNWSSNTKHQLKAPAPDFSPISSSLLGLLLQLQLLDPAPSSSS